MNKLTNVVIRPLRNFKYLKPLSVEYVINGKRKTWNTLAVHQGVSILLYNSTRKVLVFVKQFRPVIYINKIPENERLGQVDTKKYPAELGMTTELCAGIVDKNTTLEQIAVEEVDEECNYKIKPHQLEKVVTYRSDVSRQGTKQTLFYCEVTDDMRGEGDKKEEDVDIVEMTVSEVRKYILQKDCSTTAILLHAIQWFLHNKLKENYFDVLFPAKI